MAKETVSPIDVYRYLPKTNCKECGEENCMAFAVKLVNREASLDECPPLLEEKNRKSYEKIWEMIKPPVKEIEISSGSRSVKVGGELVVHRHELTYMNQPPIALDVTDEMDEQEMLAKVRKVADFKYTYIGKGLTLDLIAVRSTSGDPERFGRAVRTVAENMDLPLVLCSLDPKVMEAGLSSLGDGRPLMYAATRENWREMADLALEHECPLAVFSPGDVETLLSLSKTLSMYGVSDLALDPGTFPGRALSKTLSDLTTLRWKACNERDELLGYPLIGTPITAWAALDGDPQFKAWHEACIAGLLIEKYADLLILHSFEGWNILPLVMLRDNIYEDPRKPVAVDPGLTIIGDPDENSPVFMTTNFALTYFLVKLDIEGGKVDSYLLVADTEGISVESAVAGRRFTGDTAADTIKESGIEEKVKHRILIIPGLSARISGEIEDETGWRVAVGPRDSSDIPKFIHDKWEKILAETEEDLG